MGDKWPWTDPERARIGNILFGKTVNMICLHFPLRQSTLPSWRQLSRQHLRHRTVQTKVTATHFAFRHRRDTGRELVDSWAHCQGMKSRSCIFTASEDAEVPLHPAIPKEDTLGRSLSVMQREFNIGSQRSVAFLAFDKFSWKSLI